MMQVVAVGWVLLAAVVCVWHPKVAWAALGLFGAFLLFQLLVVRKTHRFTPLLPAVTEAEALLVERYGHYFAMPFASRDFSAAAATLQFGGILVAIVSWFPGFKFAVAFAVFNWFIMGYVATAFSPAALLAKHPELRIPHDLLLQQVEVSQSLKGP